MQKERKQLEELFEKYRHGLITEEEKILIARWLAHLEITNQDLTEAQLQVKEELSKNSLQAHFFPEQIQSAKTIHFGYWTRVVAASLFLLFTLGGVFYLKNKSNKASFAQTSFLETTTKAGEIKLITLSDGTEIALNNESTIKYPILFNGKIREVFLSGQAFFKVAHNPLKPFKVHTQKMDIQVLGTSFDIKAYKDEPKMSVAVATGRVEVSPNVKMENGKVHMLLPGDMLAYNHSTGVFIKSIVDPLTVNNWQKGKLVFKNEPLITITRQLERHYKVKFQFLNKTLQNKMLSLNMKNQSLNVVMKALSISGEFDYKITGNSIRIW